MAKQDQKEVLEDWATDLNFAVAAELWNYPHKYGGSNFSDICDEEGNYYVDLVLGGGGMLGMAHAGYIHALEESDLKFRAIAGSSAGALSAALLMGMKPELEWKGITLGALHGALKGHELLDTWAGKIWFLWKFKWRLPLIILPLLLLGFLALIFLPELPLGFLPLIILPVLLLVLLPVVRRGLISGDKFQEKLEEVLEELKKDEMGVAEDVDRLKEPPALNLIHVTGKDNTKKRREMMLTVIASDITREEKLKFPGDSHQFVNGETYSVPFFVRASSSVPVVFRPVRMERVPWKKDVPDGCFNPAPYVDVVDGGLMSNFPINVFHRPAKPGTPAEAAGCFRQPRMPTFGVQLQPTKKCPNKTHWPWSYVGALISSMLDVGDEEFIKNNPDYVKVVTIVDMSDINVEPFNLYLSREKKIELFVKGYVSGKDFLRSFDWYEYKQLRRIMSCEEPID